MIKSVQLIVCVLFLTSAIAQVPQKNPVPSKPQLAAQNMEFYLFAHFGPNTFTGAEWGKGTEHEEVFAPSNLDCKQWVRIAKAAGAKGIIITAKHHDGFCLWPSKYSKHTVRESKWKDGKGDVLKELSQACKEGGIKFGVYLSPWDRNHPAYGTVAYNDVYVNMMKEIFTNYGPIWELWWDGANGEGPNGKKQVYDWPRFKETVRKLSPNTVVFSDVGPDLRWMGNEKGFAGETNWDMLNTDGFTAGADAPKTSVLNEGEKYGKYWISGECDVSIRPGWFNHSNEDDKVKTPEQLFGLYLKSVGRGANLLLNVPPDGRGLFSTNDSAALMGFKKLRDENFKNNLALSVGKIINNVLTVKLVNKQPINCVAMHEPIAKGQFIAKGKIQILNGGNVVAEKDFTTIGKKRILTFPAIEATVVKIIVEQSRATASIGAVEIFKINDNLVEQQ